MVNECVLSIYYSEGRKYYITWSHSGSAQTEARWEEMLSGELMTAGINRTTPKSEELTWGRNVGEQSCFCCHPLTHTVDFIHDIPAGTVSHQSAALLHFILKIKHTAVICNPVSKTCEWNHPRLFPYFDASTLSHTDYQAAVWQCRLGAEAAPCCLSLIWHIKGWFSPV